MSFLLQTNDDFMKFQLRSLLLNPEKKKELKKKLKKLGLYSQRQGFGTYRDFFHTELGRVSKTPKSRRFGSIENTQPPRKRKDAKTSFPSLTHMKLPKSNGILSTQFFQRGKTAISSCVLYMLVQKLYIIPAPDIPKIPLRYRYDKEFDLKFISFYLGSFYSVYQNLNKLLIGNAMNYTPEIKKVITNAYVAICSVYGVNRKVYMRNKDTRIINHLSTKF